jgi:hypothetical protein
LKRKGKQKNLGLNYKPKKRRGTYERKCILKKGDPTFLQTSAKMNFMSVAFQVMEIFSLIKTCAHPFKNLEEMMNYGAEVCGALCGHRVQSFEFI